MKKNLNIILLAIALVAMQACGPKKENQEEAVVTEPSAPAVVKLTPEERRAK